MEKSIQRVTAKIDLDPQWDSNQPAKQGLVVAYISGQPQYAPDGKRLAIVNGDGVARR